MFFRQKQSRNIRKKHHTIHGYASAIPGMERNAETSSGGCCKSVYGRHKQLMIEFNLFDAAV